MGSGGNKTKIEVPKPFVYRTTVPEADFEYGREILGKTKDRISDLRQFERDTLGNRRYRGMVNKANRVLELGSYLSSIPADQGSYTTGGTSLTQTGSQTGSQSGSQSGSTNTTSTVPFQQQSVQASGYDPGRFGASGVGMEDLAELQRRGFNRDQISEYVDSARAQGLNIGDRVQDSLNLMHKQQGTISGAIRDSGYNPADAGEAGFGFEDVKELSGRGYGQQQIRDYVNYLQSQKETGPAQTQSVQASGYDPAAFGEAGVGMQDLTELQRQGFNKAQISAYVDAAKGQGLNIGERVQDSLAMMNKASTKSGDIKDSGYDPASFGGAGFGFEDVKELSRQGYGKEQISNYVEYLKGQERDVPYQSQSVKDSGFDPAAFGEAGVGMVDLQELQKRGFNKQQISDYVDDARSRGLNIGGRVGESLALMNKAGTKSGAIKDSGYDPAAFGMGGVGFEDVKELASRGYGKQQISDYVNYAKGQGLNIGERVGMTLDFMDPAKTKKEKYNIGEAVPTALNYMDAARTKETGKYNIGDRVGLALGFMNPERTKTQTTFGSGSGSGSTSSYTTTGFQAAPNFRSDLSQIYNDAVRDYGAFRKYYEESNQGQRSRRFAGFG